MVNDSGYIHGYSPEEQERLLRQNEVLAPYIYRDIPLDDVAHLVEIGCGVGAQLMTLLHRFPGLQVTGIESNARQIRKAEINLGGFPSFAGRFRLIEGDATILSPKWEKTPDAVLMVWVLEHVPGSLQLLRKVLSWIPARCPLYVTEVFHSSFCLYPESPEVMAYWQDTLRCQRSMGGDPDAGIRLAHLLDAAGFMEVATWPRTFLLDASRPAERRIMLDYWLDLMRSAFHVTLERGFTSLGRWQEAEAAMRAYREHEEAVFYYSFVQACARKEKAPDQNKP